MTAVAFLSVTFPFYRVVYHPVERPSKGEVVARTSAFLPLKVAQQPAERPSEAEIAVAQSSYPDEGRRLLLAVMCLGRGESH